MQNSPLPDNFVSRIKRAYVANKTFKSESGQNVDYSRLVLEFTVNGQLYPMELAIDRKDITILGLTDKPEASSL